MPDNVYDIEHSKLEIEVIQARAVDLLSEDPFGCDAFT